MRATKHQPMTRKEELVYLSRDHHDGMLLSWKINSGLNKGISVYRIMDYILYFNDNFLEPHFLEQEKYLYPLVANEHPDRRTAELQHAGIRVRIEYLKAGYKVTTEMLKDFADFLSEHIRFEERVLFNVIEQEADRSALRSVVKKTKKILKIDNGWDDQFWLQ